MRYTVRLMPSADRALGKLSRELQGRILAKLDQLAEKPDLPGTEKLPGEPGYRVRVGDYRIVYDILHQEVTILVIRIGHRREVYR
jgi:mRNA interferase RelE/StbE